MNISKTLKSLECNQRISKQSKTDKCKSWKHFVATCRYKKQWRRREERSGRDASYIGWKLFHLLRLSSNKDTLRGFQSVWWAYRECRPDFTLTLSYMGSLSLRYRRLNYFSRDQELSWCATPIDYIATFECLCISCLWIRQKINVNVNINLDLWYFTNYWNNK